MSARPVRPDHLESMAHRMADSARDRTRTIIFDGQGSPTYARALRAHERRSKALRRLCEALERQIRGAA